MEKIKEKTKKKWYTDELFIANWKKAFDEIQYYFLI